MGLFSLLGIGFIVFSLLWLLAVGMVHEGNPFPTIAFAYMLLLLALAAGCFWLSLPEAWSDTLYTPRAIVLVVVGLAVAWFGVVVINAGITLSGQLSFGEMLLPAIWALFNFTIASVCFWAAVPPWWKTAGVPREEVPS